MKNTVSLILLCCATASLTSIQTTFAAVPLRWTVETSRVQPVVFDVVRGETVALEAALQSGGKPFDTALEPVCIFWQTNGMGSAWWTRPATADANRVSAAFTPEMDPGAPAVNGFIGSSGSVYRAAFTLRFRHGPGASPNVIDQPPRVLDLANTTVINAPWPTDETISDRIRQVIDEDGIAAGTDTNEVRKVVTNTVTKAYVEGLGISGGGSAVKESETTEGNAANADHAIVADSAREAEHAEKADSATFAEKASSASYAGQSYFASMADYAYGPIDNDDHLDWSELFGRYAPNYAATKLAAEDALAYASGIYNFMSGNTNAWFAGTNYVVGAAAASRHRFQFEPGMDLTTVPCSMALWELRDGKKTAVWDQRHWVSWYWTFKAGQMRAEIKATNDLISADIEKRAPAAWSRRTAATGLVNPDASTTWIDTPKLTLAPGMAWESVAEVSGCAYWTIVGNATIGGTPGADGTAGVLTIRDFEGKPVITVKKGDSYQIYLEAGSDIYTSGYDAQGRVTFTMRATVKPTAEFSTALDDSSFVSEDVDGCPADFEWENVSSGVWRIHFLLKPTIQADACFAKFKVDMEGENVIEYTAGQVISGGLIYNGVKIAPTVTKGAAVGTTVTWKVVQ